MQFAKIVNWRKLIQIALGKICSFRLKRCEQDNFMDIGCVAI